jgi:hypothetical protein
LSSGTVFDLDFKDVYLYHKSSLGEFFLSSDTMTNTYFGWIIEGMDEIIKEIPANEMTEFVYVANTIGNRIIFPCRKNSINQQRNRVGKIRDRFDFTLECIRRYYSGETSPLTCTIQNDSNFFKLFHDFRGYVNFFLLQDLVSDDYKAVKYWLKDFDSDPLPANKDEYLEYKEKSIEFISKRNDRIQSLFP